MTFAGLPLRRVGVPTLALLVGATGAFFVPRSAEAATHQRIPGFTPAHSAWEHRYENAYLQTSSAGVAERLDAYLSRKPGLVATPGDWRRARYVAKKFRQWGLTPEIHTYYTYLSVPKHISVEMTAPRHVKAHVKEPKRPWERDFKDVVVGYNALSPSGDVTAPAVYVNYGTVDDYKVLAKKGVSVKGKIVIARYGQVYRGVKTNLAAKHGAKGVILYSDPADDGYVRGKTYPDGPWRSARGIQRGTVQKIWKYIGDPLTPGWAATKNARRLPTDKANIGDVPTSPIGYGDAKPMLAELSGPKAPKSWQGGLPFAYHIGPGSTRVHLDLDIDYRTKPIWDVTARVPGSTHPHQVVYVGAHRDTWTYGSDDNLSGTEDVLQVARGLGKLLERGWRPKRTVVLATWDGEEYGAYGSTEYAEQLGMRRLDRAVGYINIDGGAGKYFHASAVPSLDKLIYGTTKQVHWPGTDTTIYGAWSKRSGGGKPGVGRLGGGSDYGSFLQRFGVPSVNPGASTPGGDYHCACDNHYWMSHFGDPTWRYHKAMGRVIGLMTLRLANADVVSLRYAGYASAVRSYLKDFQQAQEDAYGRQVVDVSRDIAAARAWQRAAERFRAKIQDRLSRGGHGRGFTSFNRKLMRVERDLLAREGLPGRPWYRHQIYAPAVNGGYGVLTLPGLHDALFLHHNPRQARHYERLLHRSLKKAGHTLTG
ncbi:MAG: transferrin receptor-like dimerization domain-containing protein [Nocardioidaceae bacterium]